MKKKSVFVMVLILATLISGCKSSNENIQVNWNNKAKNVTEISTTPQISSIGVEYDPLKSISDNINCFINEMTLKEKVGQMLQVERGCISAKEVKEYCIGSVFAGGSSAPEDNTLDGWRRMTKEYKDASKETRLSIPITFALDAVHGNNNMKDTVIFPHNIGLGASWDSGLIEKIALSTSNELDAAGIDWSFSPCIAVSNDIRWGRCYESFSENTDLVSIMGIHYIKELQKNGIIACAKHFVGDGAVEFGTGDIGYLMYRGNVNIGHRELYDKYIEPYRQAVTAGVKSIMISYSSINNVKNHGNKKLIQDVLKDDIGFTGIVLSDYEGIHQLEADSVYKQVVWGVNAGIDMLTEVTQWRECYNALLEAIDKKDIKMNRINDAVSRILRVKMEMNIFETEDNNTNYNFKLRNYYSRKVAEEATRKSLVLLKNDKKILPLNKRGKIAVIGPAADNIGIQCGGWTKTWQGGLDDADKGRWMSGTTILDGFIDVAEQYNGKIITRLDKIKEADVIVVVLGEYPYAEGRGDDDALSISNGTALMENEEALKVAYEAKKPIVVIMVSGRPRIVTEHINKWDSFVQAWLPGTEGAIIANVLYGDYEFTARLPVTWPKSVGQLPITLRDQKNGKNGLFEYGYGLNMR